MKKICQTCRQEFNATCGVAIFCSDSCHINSKAVRIGKCLVWTGAVDKDGYGTVRLKGRRRERVHRVAYREAKSEIPKGKMVCHSCDTPACMEEDHLFAGTALDNKTDCVSKGRHVRGEAMWSCKLTPAKVFEILDDKRPGAEIAKDYGVTKEAIYAVQTGKTWKGLRVS